MTSEILKIELTTQLEIKQAEILSLESDLNPLPFIKGILKTRRQEADNLKTQLKTLFTMANLIITPTDQLTILDLLDHYRRTTDPNKDIYAHNKQSLRMKVNNNKSENNHFRDLNF